MNLQLSNSPLLTQVDDDTYEWARAQTWRLQRGYVRASDGQFLHRRVLGLDGSDQRVVDHINGDPLDNRRTNLRACSCGENMQNQGSRGGTSKYRGVFWDKARCKWRAVAVLDGKVNVLGRFEHELTAGVVASRFRAKRMPFSADARLRRVALKANVTPPGVLPGFGTGTDVELAIAGDFVSLRIPGHAERVFDYSELVAEIAPAQRRAA